LCGFAHPPLYDPYAFMIRVLISAPSPVTRARLANRLRSFSQFQVVEAPSDQIVASADLQPDVHLAVVDNDDEATITLDDSARRIPLILLLSDNPAIPVDAIRQGTFAVLPNDLADLQLAAAIEAVAAGLGVFIPDETLDEAEGTMLPFAAHSPRPPESLTSREIEVLRAMADGLTNKEIAVRLRISENTAKFHVGSVMGKMGARSRTEAVMLGVRYGIVLI
jgi:DNA-binding NarL/FixJ family response regulator